MEFYEILIMTIEEDLLEMALNNYEQENFIGQMYNLRLLQGINHCKKCKLMFPNLGTKYVRVEIMSENLDEPIPLIKCLKI